VRHFWLTTCSVQCSRRIRTWMTLSVNCRPCHTEWNIWQKAGAINSSQHSLFPFVLFLFLLYYSDYTFTFINISCPYFAFMSSPPFTLPFFLRSFLPLIPFVAHNFVFSVYVSLYLRVSSLFIFLFPVLSTSLTFSSLSAAFSVWP
jgi:hypothetical protein